MQNGDAWVARLCEGREKWLALLEQSREQFGGKFRSFTEAGVAGVMEMTGLAKKDAAQALQREFGEPLLWLGSDVEYADFRDYMSSHGATLVRGDRFIHVSGNCSKGMALVWLMARYREQPGRSETVSVAIGNSANDESMLDAADHAIIIRTGDSPPPVVSPRHGKYIIRTSRSGAEGWVEGVTGLLDKLELTDLLNSANG